MDNEQEFSPQESLQIIRSMIETTKCSISDKSHYFLLWGWAVFTGCSLQYYLKVIANVPQHYLAWLIVPVAFIFHILFIVRDRKRERVRTFINDANIYLWTAIVLCYFALLFLFQKIGWEYAYAFYILLYGIGTYVSGSLIRFKPLIVGGVLCFPLAVITGYAGYDTQIILLALAILISYIIPGHLLRIQYRKQSQS